MKRMNKFSSVALTVLIGLMPLTAKAAFADTSDLLKQQQQIQEQLKQTQSLLDQTKKKEQTKIQELKSLSANIQTTNNELNKINTNLNGTETDIKSLNTELAETQAKQEQQTQYLSDRLNEMYIEGDVKFLEVLLDSTNITDFLTRWDFISKIAENDVQVISSLNETVEKVTAQKNLLDNKKTQLVSLQQDRTNKRNELQIISSREKQVLKDIERQKAEYEAMEREQQAESNRVAQEIRKLQSPNESYQGNGKFYWPVPGYTRITSPYGPRIHPVYKTKSVHTGIDIAVPMNTSVHAAEVGKVIFAGWNTAYGNMTIIDHGAGITTLYGHQSSISVKVGQQVKKGEVIGKSGSTGWSTGPHLHFEVRKNGNPTSPMNYLK